MRKAQGRPKHGCYNGVMYYLNFQKTNLEKLTHAEVVERVFENIIWGKDEEGNPVKAQNCSQPSRTAVINWVDEVLPNLVKREYVSNVIKAPSAKFNVTNISKKDIMKHIKHTIKFASDNSGLTTDEILIELAK